MSVNLFDEMSRGLVPTFVDLTPRRRLVDVRNRAQIIFLNGVLQREGKKHDYIVRRINRGQGTKTLKFDSPFQVGDVLGFIA